MSSDNYKTIVLSLPVAALLTVSQAAIGCGIGILLADKFSESKRNTAAVAMLCLAIVTTAPALVGAVADLVNGPQSKLGVRRRLRSIREGAGLQTEEELL
jgi:ABC-type molybdate transport system permease subunit